MEKKNDAVEHLEAFDRVGVLVNEPPGFAGLPFASHPTICLPITERYRVTVPLGSLYAIGRRIAMDILHLKNS